MDSTTEELSLGGNSYLFHHVFLPPRLPQSDDYNPKHELLLIDDIICAGFETYLSGQQAVEITIIIAMMCRLRESCDLDGGIREQELKRNFQDLDAKGGLLPIFVRDQNAGILMTSIPNAIRVEAFELSPRNEPVMKTLGRLQRVFPGPGLELDPAIFKESEFQDAIAHTLARMSQQPVAGTKPKVRKARKDHDEDRDTTDPKMVTEFMISVLRPRSRDCMGEQIHKNTREEVMWRDSRSPWRRSALWLFVRVILHLTFTRLSSFKKDSDMYKHFMVYFMGTVIRKCHHDIPRESLYLMTAKVGRRLLKLDLADEPTWFGFLQDVLSQAADVVRAKWNEIREKGSRRLNTSSLESLDFFRDTHFTLSKLNQYLEKIHSPDLESLENSSEYRPESNLLKLFPSELPKYVDFGNDRNRTYNLAVLESWVGLNLDHWLDTHKADADTCKSIAGLMKSYHSSAHSLYSKNPEAVSVMLLTLLELWIACDKSATHIHGLLSDYDVYIPVGLFQSLVLPFGSQMLRLARAEKYLTERQRSSKYSGPGIFRDFGTKNCFSVRYFDLSSDMQQLHKRIENDAEEERAKKKSELQEKQQEYRRLKTLALRMECTYYDVVVDKIHGIREKRHSKNCPKCQHEKKANSIQITVHEWPLSPCNLRAKSTVFELIVPEPFFYWRDTTVFLLFDVLGMKHASSERPRAS